MKDDADRTAEAVLRFTDKEDKVMNELMITVGGGQWMYYRTDQTAADKAFQEFTESCDAAGINIDNVNILGVHLRGRDGEDIDRIEF